MLRVRRVQSRAFTLVEAIATMAIIGTVGLLSSRVIFAAADAYAADAVRAEMTLDLSAAMERIAAELRSVPSRDGSVGTPWIDLAASTAIEFGNGSRIALAGSELELTIDGGTARTLLKDVSGFTLSYFDAAGQPLAAPMNTAGCDTLRRIQVTVSQTRSGATETLRTRVFLRCGAAGGGS